MKRRRQPSVRPEDLPVETPEHCTKAYNQPCLLHPLDCPTCIHGAYYEEKADKLKHPEIFKSCRHYRHVAASPIDVALGLHPTRG